MFNYANVAKYALCENKSELNKHLNVYSGCFLSTCLKKKRHYRSKTGQNVKICLC